MKFGSCRRSAGRLTSVAHLCPILAHPRFRYTFHPEECTPAFSPRFLQTIPILLLRPIPSLVVNNDRNDFQKPVFRPLGQTSAADPPLWSRREFDFRASSGKNHPLVGRMKEGMKDEQIGRMKDEGYAERISSKFGQSHPLVGAIEDARITSSGKATNRKGLVAATLHIDHAWQGLMAGLPLEWRR